STKEYLNAEAEEESEYETEYEDEDDLFESSIYFSDGIYSSDDEDLEFNPWADYVPLPIEEKEILEQEEAKENNPAVYLATVATKEETPPLNLGPLDSHQQQLFHDLLQHHKDICTKSQTEIGRTNIIKHRIEIGDAHPISQAPYRLNPKNRRFLKDEIVNM